MATQAVLAEKLGISDRAVSKWENEDAIRFYEAHGFKLNGKRQLEEGTPEYIVMLERD